MNIKYYEKTYEYSAQLSSITSCNGFVKSLGASNYTLELKATNNIEKQIIQDGLWLEYCEKLGCKFEVKDDIIILKTKDYHNYIISNRNYAFYFYFSIIRLGFLSTTQEEYNQLKEILSSDKKYKRISSILIALSFYKELNSFLSEKNSSSATFAGFHKGFYSGQISLPQNRNIVNIINNYFHDLYPKVKTQSIYMYLGCLIRKPYTFTLKDVETTLSKPFSPIVIYESIMYSELYKSFKTEKELIEDSIISLPIVFTVDEREKINTWQTDYPTPLDKIKFVSEEKEKLYKPLLENFTLENCLKFINKIN